MPLHRRAPPTPSGLPPERLPEVAFLGRSNVGKSSLVNALTGRNALARVSRTPGRTRQIIFFELRPADAGRSAGLWLRQPRRRTRSRAGAGWCALYLKGRAGLKRVLLLIDARHGLKPADRDFMELLDEAAVSFQIVLTKLDKVRRARAAGAACGRSRRSSHRTSRRIRRST